MKKLPGFRRSLFEQIEQAHLLPLPSWHYDYQDVRIAWVNFDYHIEYDKHYYSVPHMNGNALNCSYDFKTFPQLDRYG